jgi:predicted peptidase
MELRVMELFPRCCTLVSAALLIEGCTPQARGVPPVGEPGLHARRIVVQIPARADTSSLLLYVPRDLPPGEPLPTVLYLHGGSHRGTDLDMLNAYGPPRVPAEGGTLPFILIAPQLPEGEIWSDADGLIGLVDELSRNYPIDSARLYVIGMSMGGRGAWYLAYRYPQRFAAIAAVAAFQPIPHWASSGRLGRLPIRAYHGEEDQVAPFAGAVRMNEALQAVGGNSELVALPGRDHFIADILDDPALFEWLLRHRCDRGDAE